MKQYILNNNKLTLRVKKSPFLIRFIMFLFTFLFFIAPILGLIGSIINGKRFHVGLLIMIGIFSLIGFYMLRMSLWNTYGHEVISFRNNNVTYEANYGWFKDGKKSIELNPVTFSIKQVGYLDDHAGVLIIGVDENEIQCSTKMPIAEIEGMVIELKNMNNNELL